MAQRLYLLRAWRSEERPIDAFAMIAPPLARLWHALATTHPSHPLPLSPPPPPQNSLLSCTDRQLAAYPNVGLVPTTVVPSWSHNPHNNDDYTAYNKPAGIAHWLAHARPRQHWILIIDPDMVLRDPFADWGRLYGAEAGSWAVSAYFGYMVGTHNNLSDAHVPEVAPRRDAYAGPRGRRGDQVSSLVLMAAPDLAKVAPLWLQYSEAVRDDPMAWNETGDDYAKTPGTKPWIAEMYGYSFGAAKADVWHKVDHSAMLYPGHTPRGEGFFFLTFFFFFFFFGGGGGGGVFFPIVV
jgi:peptidyl serine alpha-galactosyltransferase